MEEKQLKLREGSFDLFFKGFNELELSELYEILQLRSEIFVVEQCCVYQDIDGEDENAIHLLAKDGQKIVAYCRILANESKKISFGRVVVHSDYRNQGLAKGISEVCMNYIDDKYSKPTVEIMAQVYLKDFYSSLGFKVVGEEFREDHLPHVNMLRK